MSVCTKVQNRNIHLTRIVLKKELVVRSRDHFDTENRSKETFLAAINMFYTRDVHRRGHVEFIYSALSHLEEYGLNRDLDTYKKILDVLPKGKMIPTNVFQAEFTHYPKQQQCAIDVLEKMEDNGVIPDPEVEAMIMNTFGKHGHPMKKLMRMSYWLPKFKHASPWALPEVIPSSNLEIGKLAVARMCSVDPASVIETFETKELEDSIDDTWIVSGQSPIQQELLEKMEPYKTVYVEGGFPIWLRRTSINYFILRSEPVPPSKTELDLNSQFDFDDVSQLQSWILGEENLTSKDVLVPPSVHEQEDGTVLAIAVTGTSSKDSLLSWIRFLERKNPHLANLSIMFATSSPLGEVTPFIESGTEALQDTPKITDGSGS
uniref:Evolutionarily conserved signaling intermediate in Toll pathway, mitochondrial n=1 Tax=Evadne anonyx TaxID=141404 RepID=A0A9N6WRV5_9CRUS|nr:EOG090X07J4 [Evadne anonyx]